MDSLIFSFRPPTRSFGFNQEQERSTFFDSQERLRPLFRLYIEASDVGEVCAVVFDNRDIKRNRSIPSTRVGMDTKFLSMKSNRLLAKLAPKSLLPSL